MAPPELSGAGNPPLPPEGTARVPDAATVEPPPWLPPLIRRTIWRVLITALVFAVLVRAAAEARHLISLLVISVFFSLALAPAVNWLSSHRHWRRGTAVAVIYLAGVVVAAGLILVLIPAVVTLAEAISTELPQWMASLNSFTSENLGFTIGNEQSASEAATTVGLELAGWADEMFGAIAGIATSGIGFLFDMATIALFVFYLTADMPKIRRLLLTRLPAHRQQRIGWVWDQAIRETGGYFYSRLLIMGINGSLFFFALLVVGMPIGLATALALFESFVATFIPAVGTYIGSAVPLLVTLAMEGTTAALILLAWVLIYQQLENYVLSPRLSARTMSLNGGVSFGAALAGGAIAGPMGAFMSLPVAALITSFASNYLRSYEVVYTSEFEAAEGASSLLADPS